MTEATGSIVCVISDFGGVLTTPLIDAFAAIQDEHGLPLEALGRALQRVSERDGGAHPLFELECGRVTEADFLADLRWALREDLGREVELHEFSERYFSALSPNDELIAYMASLRDRGFRMALLTNNVAEWEPRWRAMLPVDEIFELVVDSAFVGMRKPDPAIYELTLERLGLRAEQCAFLDDIEINCDAAGELGLHPVQFRETAQAIAELEALLPASPGAA